MVTLLKISWRNIWRSPLRSIVVILAVGVGIWSTITLVSFSRGITNSYVQRSIQFQTSFIQIHHTKFLEDKEAKYTIANADSIVKQIAKMPKVAQATQRTLVSSILFTAKGSRGVLIRGVNPQTEAITTTIDQKIVEGKYFSDKKNQIIIGKPLAKKLKLKINKKVVLQFQNTHGDLISAAFRVAGIYDIENTIFGLTNVYVKQSTLNPLLSQYKMTHEIAITLKNPNDLDAQVSLLTQQYPSLDIKNYRQLSPDVELYETNIDLSSTIFIFIFMLALIFGIINTMLMAILERQRELGMLMAVGLNKIKVFIMIMAETFMLSLIGLPIGILLGFITVQIFSFTGLDLSNFSQGIEQFGLSAIIYPDIDNNIYLKLGISVSITAFLAAIYPAIRAISIKPIEAMRI